ncbi:MAG: hypothetical protein ACNA7E_11095 [Wenzhouxiangellaceae bacterium]
MNILRGLVLILAIVLTCNAAALETIELEQDPEIALEHQRMPGNARAQAERRGVVRSVPHLFVYHPNAARSPAFFMSGLRRGFEHQLRLMLDDFRVHRSMVPLDVLLEHAMTDDGSRLQPADLPPRRVVMVLYRGPDCADCDALEEQLAAWLEDRPDLDPLLLRVRLP